MNVLESLENYFKTDDFRETDGRVFTVKGAEKREIGQEKEIKAVLFVEEDHRGFVLNKTQARTLASLLDSPESSDWVGKKVKAVCDPNVRYAGKAVGGIAFERA